MLVLFVATSTRVCREILHKMQELGLWRGSSIELGVAHVRVRNHTMIPLFLTFFVAIYPPLTQNTVQVLLEKENLFYLIVSYIGISGTKE